MWACRERVWFSLFVRIVLPIIHTPSPPIARGTIASGKKRKAKNTVIPRQTAHQRIINTMRHPDAAALIPLSKTKEANVLFEGFREMHYAESFECWALS
ncbi:MAG: hypothetical protein ACI9FG_001744 [Crocinitomicaceae bacterium]